MTTIAEYVKTQVDEELSESHRRVADYFDKASKHQREAVRLYELGDYRQAEMHSNIARRNVQTGLDVRHGAAEQMSRSDLYARRR